MNTDFYLKRGKDHPICEDFASAGMAGGKAFALVSDGCSSSKDVDFGSRILVHAAREELTLLPALEASFDPMAFGRATIARARKVLGCLATLPESVLDATLLLAVVRQDVSTQSFRARVCFWGDGAAIVRRKGGVQATLVRFAHNAPYYLSYSLNEPRRKAYLDQQGGRRQVLRVALDFEGKQLSRERNQEAIADPCMPYQEQIHLEAGDSLALVSDGITQFVRPENTPVPWEKLAPQLVDFKRSTGVFVRRRMNFFERQNRAVGIRQLDDLSVAAITLLP